MDASSDTHIKGLKQVASDIRYLPNELCASQQSNAVDRPAIPVHINGKTFSNDVRETSYQLQSLGVCAILCTTSLP